jgi:branched-chain amino acid transport system ATP-binding protein
MGKTTLCQALMGLVPPASGSIRFEDQELAGEKSYRIASAGIGYVPQGRRIFPSLTVHEHLRIVPSAQRTARNGAQRTARGSDSGRQRWTIDRIYDLFPRLAERKKNGAAQLSGGEQQMLVIGRALLTNPRLLIMDEPSEGLAPVIVDQLLETLQRLSREGIGILIVEQKLAVATAVAEHVVIMVSGRVAHQTTSTELLSDVEAQRRFLGVSPR